MRIRFKALVISSEDDIFQKIKDILNKHNFVVEYTNNFDIRSLRLLLYQFDIIFCDLEFSKNIDLANLCKLFNNAAPSVIVTASRKYMDRVEFAIENGAHDYIIKENIERELLLRIIITARRNISLNLQKSAITIGDLTFDYKKQIVTKNGRKLDLTPCEFKIAVLLAENAGIVVTYRNLMEYVWNGASVFDKEIIRVNITNIRKKIEDNLARPKYIITVKGVGYFMPLYRKEAESATIETTAASGELPQLN